MRLLLRAAVLAVVLTLPCVAGAVVFRVDAGARPGGSGSWWRPFRTLAEARDAIRAGRASGAIATNEPVTVKIAAGEYTTGTPFVLDRRDGGSPGAPVIYRGVGADRTLITPSGVLRAADALPPDPVHPDCVRFLARQIPVPGLPNPALYWRGRPLPCARWPNAGWATFTNVVDHGEPPVPDRRTGSGRGRPGAFVFDSDRPSRWSPAATLTGYWTHDWDARTLPLGSWNPTNHVLRLGAACPYGIGNRTWGGRARRFFVNDISELDAPGEWWWDEATGILSLLPPAGYVSAKAELRLSFGMDWLVAVEGADHVVFEDLAFGFARAGGLWVNGSRHVELRRLRILGCGGCGVKIDANCAACVVRHCMIRDVGACGVVLAGGDRRLLIAGSNMVEDCEISDFARVQRTYAPGVAVSGCGQVVRHCFIHDAPHCAILYNGNEHLIESNEVCHVVTETGDAGAFYTGRDWASQGNVVRWNFIHDLGGPDVPADMTMGVYLDDCDCGDAIVSNRFLRAGRAIMVGGGRSNTVVGNRVEDCAIGLHVDARGMTWPQWNDPKDGWGLEAVALALGYTNALWAARYPDLARIMSDSPREPLHNLIVSNSFIRCARTYDLDANVKELIAAGRLDVSSNTVITVR